MRRFLVFATVFLGLSFEACANDGSLLVVERKDAQGSHAFFLRVAKKNGSWSLEKVGGMAMPAGSTFGFAPDGSGVDGHGYVLQSTATALHHSSRLWAVAPGKLPHSVRDWADVAPQGASVFATGELVAWDVAHEGLSIVSPAGIEAVSPDHFLGMPLHDVRVGRVGEERVAVLGYVGPKAPDPAYPADYFLFLVRLEPNYGATVLTSKSVKGRLPGSPTVFAPSGLYYLSADRRGRFVQHAPYEHASNSSAYFRNLAVPTSVPFVPLGVGPTNRGEAIYMRKGDDLTADWGNGSGRTTVSTSLFSASAWDAATGHRAQGPVTNVIVAVQPRLSSGWDIPYEKLFVDRTVDAATRQAQASLRSQLETRLQALLGPWPKDRTELDALAVVDALNRRPMESDWLAQLVGALPPEERRKYHVDNRGGIDFVHPPAGATIPIAAFFDALLASPRCSRILAGP